MIAGQLLTIVETTNLITKLIKDNPPTVDLSNYVQKDGAKVLSTNDYTTAEKTKLTGVATGANNYVLPAAGAVIGGVKKGTSVADATDAASVITQFNILLATLRTAGVIS